MIRTFPTLVLVTVALAGCGHTSTTSSSVKDDASQGQGDCRDKESGCDLKTASDSAPKAGAAADGRKPPVYLDQGLGLAEGSKICVTGTGLARGEKWSSTLFSWEAEHNIVANNISDDIGYADFQRVAFEARCIANTQAGVTSCGIQAIITEGNVEPDVSIRWFGYLTASDKSQMASDTAANNGVATVNAGFAKGAGVSLAWQPSVGFSYAGANVGVTISGAAVSYKREYTVQESCQAVDAN